MKPKTRVFSDGIHWIQVLCESDVIHAVRGTETSAAVHRRRGGQLHFCLRWTRGVFLYPRGCLLCRRAVKLSEFRGRREPSGRREVMQMTGRPRVPVSAVLPGLLWGRVGRAGVPDRAAPPSWVMWSAEELVIWAFRRRLVSPSVHAVRKHLVSLI